MIINTDDMTPEQYEAYLLAKDTNNHHMLGLLQDLENMRGELDDAQAAQMKLEEVEQDLDSANLRVEELEAEVDNLETKIELLEDELEELKAQGNE